jgi:hypothetical protein
MTSGDQVAGQIDGSLDFDGSNDYINAGADSSLDMGVDDFSWGYWFKSGTTNSNKEIAGKGGGWTGGKRYHSALNDGVCGPVGHIVVQIDDGTTEKQICSTSSSLNNNAWHHIYGVRDGDNLRLFVDGSEDGNSPIDVSGEGSIDSPRPFAIGAVYKEDTSAYTWFFPGEIDQVTVSNVARSSDWISTEYNNQSATSTFYTIGAEETSPVSSP